MAKRKSDMISDIPPDGGRGGGALSIPDIVSQINEWGSKYSLVLIDDGNRDPPKATYEQLIAGIDLPQPPKRIMRVHVSHNKLQPGNTDVANINVVQVDVKVDDPITVGNVQERLVVAQDNGTIAVAETDEQTGEHYVRYGIEQGWVCKVADTATNNFEPVKLPDAPHCIHVFGTAVYLGFSRSVGWVDFSSSEPKYVQVCERNMQRKAYDLFARKDDFLVAVDDRMRPFYGDSFHLVGGNKAPVHDEGWVLPSLVNGSYELAAISNVNELLLSYAFVHRGGHGQTLMRLPISTMKGNAGRHAPKTSYVQEISRGYGNRSTITEPNDEITNWESMAICDDDNSIMLAAGLRGLLKIPSQFDTSTKATVYKFGVPTNYVNVTSVTCVKDGMTWVTLGSKKDDPFQLKLIQIGKQGEKLYEVELPAGNFRLLS